MAWLRKIRLHLDKIVLLLILVFIFARNYTFGTFLIGWDNLLPELNIWMNLKRSFLAVWQEYQGLGLVGGMGHATDLIRQILILPFTLLLPNSLIRYIWHFFTIGFGTFGIYFGLKKLFPHQKSVPFVSALFYLLNFGTVQNYWAPFEPFSTFFAFFPWLMFSLWNYLEKPKDIRNWSLVILFNLLAIPSFYVPTIFIVYLLFVFSILLAYFFTHQKQAFKPISQTLITIFCLNAFWLLPFLYFVKNDITNPQLGFGNLMATQETVGRNLNRGHLSDFLLLRGYYYDLQDDGQPLMLPWQNHLSNPFVLIFAYLLSTIVLVGLFRLLFKRESKPSFQKLSLLIIFFICATALLSALPPFSFLNYLIRQISVLDQVFRSPFTKFVIPSIFCFTLLFATGLDWLMSLVSKIKFIKFLFPTIFTLCLFIVAFPVFTGNLIYPQMRQNIPEEYFQLINFFKSVPETERIANLPSSNYWGWTNYRFGAKGSGFIWYGIEQPILDRAFDVWNLKNEQYYWELNYAIQKQDSSQLQDIFNKYSVSYVVFDNNIFIPDEAIYADQATPTREMLNQMSQLSLVAQYGQIYIYKNQAKTSPYSISNTSTVSHPGFYYQDLAFSKQGNYITTDQNDTVYPFSDLFTNRLPQELPYQIEINQNTIKIKKTLNLKQKYDLFSNSNLSINFSPDSFIEASWPNTQSFSWQNPNPNDVLVHTSDSQKIITENNQNLIRLSSNNNEPNLFAVYFPEPIFNKSYLVSIEYRHLSGYPLALSAFNQPGRHYFFNTKLDSKTDWQTANFVVPPQNDSFNSGLTLLFNSHSFNQQSSVNDIKSVKVYPLPFNELQNIKLTRPAITHANSPQYLDSKPHLFYYKVVTTSDPYLVLPQTYHKGWLAFYMDGFKPKFLSSHVLFNNWANGWILPQEIYSSPTTIYLLFWPQILQFIGFGLLILSLI